MKRYLILLLIFVGCKKDSDINIPDEGGYFTYKPHQVIPGVQVGSIYFSQKFNAFTDLAYFQHRWFAVFREGTQHVGGAAGTIKLLVSADGERWKIEKTYTADSLDLRDPKLIVDTASNSLFVTFFAIHLKKEADNSIKNFYVKYSAEDQVSDVTEIIENWPNKHNYYLWRWTAERTENYCMAYRISRYQDTSTNLILMSSNNQFKTLKVVKNLNLQGQPTETTIRFDDQKKMFVVIRSDAGAFHVGSAEKPYNKFTWVANETFTRLASPNFLFYKSYLLITGRDLKDNKFRFFVFNKSSNKIEKEITFPGGYEVGYAGMEFNPANSSELWISYYSIETGGGSNVYLSKISLPEIFK